MPTLEFNFSSVFNRKSLAAAKEEMARVMLDRVRIRIESGGDEESRFAPLDFARPNGTSGNPLRATGTHLLDSLSFGMDGESFWVGTTFIGARIHQFGTIGKGGMLPSIKPVKAKALFVPMTKLAAKSELVGAKRFGVKKSKGKRVLVDLVGRGQTRLTVGGKKAKNQDPDFLLLQKVDIRPRPYLKLTALDRKTMIAAGFPKGGG